MNKGLFECDIGVKDRETYINVLELSGAGRQLKLAAEGEWMNGVFESVMQVNG